MLEDKINFRENMGKKLLRPLALAVLTLGTSYFLSGCGDEPDKCDSNQQCSGGYVCQEDCTGRCGEPQPCEYICVLPPSQCADYSCLERDIGTVSFAEYQGACFQERQEKK